jgi:hypothetical protein
MIEIICNARKMKIAELRNVQGHGRMHSTAITDTNAIAKVAISTGGA